jgi:hypothetical protein
MACTITHPIIAAANFSPGKFAAAMLMATPGWRLAQEQASTIEFFRSGHP